MMTLETLLEQVRAELQAEADEGGRQSAQRFFREPVNALGVTAPKVRRIAAGAYRELKSWPKSQRNRWCSELWKSGCLEEGSLVIEVYRRFRRSCSDCEFYLFEKWIDRFVTNWAHCDGIACWLLAAALENEPSLIRALPAWTRSAHRWKRRAAAVALVPAARRGASTETVLQVSGLLVEDPDEMVQKGAGWLLKAAYSKQPDEVLALLSERKQAIPRLVLRYAAEKMTADHRAVVLA